MTQRQRQYLETRRQNARAELRRRLDEAERPERHPQQQENSK